MVGWRDEYLDEEDRGLNGRGERRVPLSPAAASASAPGRPRGPPPPPLASASARRTRAANRRAPPGRTVRADRAGCLPPWVWAASGRLQNYTPKSCQLAGDRQSSAKGLNRSTGTFPRVNRYGRFSSSSFHVLVLDADATSQRTDCTSTDGLVALAIGAGPDTNRSAGLHSRVVLTPKGSTCGLPSSPAAGLTCVMHLREHVIGKLLALAV